MAEQNEELVVGLKNYGLGYEDRAFLLLIPPTVIAWSDKKFQWKEFRQIVDGQKKEEDPDIKMTEKGRKFLNRKFFYQQPDCDLVGEMLELCLLYLHSVPTKKADELRAKMAIMCRMVAQACGGIRGITNPISRAERLEIEFVEQFFSLPRILPE